MALSKPATSQLSSQLSMDTDPLSPQAESRFRPTFSLSSRNVSADALAGPQDASRRSTQELKLEAARMKGRPEHLGFEKQPPKSVTRSSSRSREELDQVESQIHDRLDNMSINKGQDSSYSSLNSDDSLGSILSSMPSAEWDEELKEYKDKMPPEIRMGYIDVLILYCEDDREKAEEFRQHLLSEIEVPNGPVETLLYDDAEMQAICGSKIQHLAKGVERSTYVFIFMTKNFIDDKWCEFSSESCLMEAITNPDKQWCVVPVYTEKRNSSFRVPMGLNTLKGINYYNNDRFYKSGVSRLIGDKVNVRIQANERHKIKQKKWLEEYKREQIILIENQRRIKQFEEAKTQQLLDWLDEETKRLIHAGKLPNFMHHSSSESDISSHASSVSHSSSSSSLKPVHSQNPAVAAYFQQLAAQQRAFNWNSENYSPDQIRIIEQVFGSTSPQTPGYQNHVSPPVMNPYLGQGQFGQGHFVQSQEYFPPVSSSASYPNQFQHQVKRSTSQTSADMRPSTQFTLHTETGDISVPVPSVLMERIKGHSEDEQQAFVQLYLKEEQDMQRQREQLQQQQAVNQQLTAGQYRNPASPNTGPDQSSYAVPSYTQQQQRLISNPFQGGVPNFDVLHSMSAPGSYQTGSSYNESASSMQSGFSSGMSSVQHQSSGGHLGSYMDGNRSNFQGNLPNDSLLQQDAGSSLTSRLYQSMPSGQKPVNQAEQSAEKDGPSDSETDEDTPKEVTKRTKKKGKQVVHIHKTYIYQPKTVQIGDNNVVQEQKSDESSGEESVSKDSGSPVPDNKTGVGNDPASVSLEEKHEMVDIKPGSETHGEMLDQPSSAGGNSSCNIDAAPSTVRTLFSSVSQEQPVMGKKQFANELTAIKSAAEDEIEEAEEVLADVKQTKLEDSQENKFENSSKFDESSENFIQVSDEENSKLEESVNFKSTLSTEKSSSLKRKEMPVEDSCTKQAVKPICVARPVAAVHPFSPKVLEDDYDDNCDNTDPKTLVKDARTVMKSEKSSSERESSSEQTYVKQAWCGNNQQSVRTHTEQMPPNIPVQVLTKTDASGDSVSNGSAKFSSYKQSDPQNLFFNRKFSPPVRTSDEELSSLDSALSVSGPQEVALGNDPLSRESQEDPASRSFIPQSSPFTPLEENDLEYDMLESGNYESASYPNQNSSSLEESGTRLNKSWNRRGSPTGNSKKECVIS